MIQFSSGFGFGLHLERGTCLDLDRCTIFSTHEKMDDVSQRKVVWDSIKNSSI